MKTVWRVVRRSGGSAKGRSTMKEFSSREKGKGVGACGDLEFLICDSQFVLCALSEADMHYMGDIAAEVLASATK